MDHASRRVFLGRVGQGMLITSLGSAFAGELGAASLLRGDSPPIIPPVLPSELEKLIGLMQQTSADELQPKLVAALKSGTKLETLVTAGALANARTFGGSNYIGFHAFMALLPAYTMAQRMPKSLRALPVLKVLYRNTANIQNAGGGRTEQKPVEASARRKRFSPQQLQEAVRGRDLAAADAGFAKLCAEDLEGAYDSLQWIVQDATDVHRVVLPWRAWDMLQLTGREHAHTMLRQSVRYCVKSEKSRIDHRRPEPAVRSVLTKVLDEHKLNGRNLGRKRPDDAWVEELSGIVFGPNRADAAHAVGAALAEGFAPEAIGEALALAANRLLLHSRPDPKRRGGVYGASTGVHAADAANAWRNIARVSNQRNRIASLVVGAFHTAGQTGYVNKHPLPFAERSKQLETKDPDALLRETRGAIESRDQLGVCALVHRYGEFGHPAPRMFDLMLEYAVSEDGALHAEKYFHTAAEEFESMRPAFRWRQLVALARVTASEFGEPAPGVKAARKLLIS